MSELKYIEKRKNLDLDILKFVQLMRDEGLYDLYHIGYKEKLRHIEIIMYTGEQYDQRLTHTQMAQFTQRYGLDNIRDRYSDRVMYFTFFIPDGFFYARYHNHILNCFRKHKLMLLT